jgi:CubicO group peptidase (beta-lactamase class C family)
MLFYGTLLCCAAAQVLLGAGGSAAAAPPAPVFPGRHWEKAPPAQLGLDEEGLRRYAKRLKGDGLIVRYGRIAHEWGDLATRRDWASAGKPLLSTLLLLAVEHGGIASVHTRLTDLGWNLRGKDAGITFGHLTNMTSGYACGEAPGAAWAYNDVGIRLLGTSLQGALGRPLAEAAWEYLAPLQLEDGYVFGSRDGLGAFMSPRDMARVGLLWLEQGQWEKKKLISRKLWTRNMKIQVPADLPRSSLPGQDYLGVGTYGGGVNQTAHGPGAYGFGFWFNATLATGEKVWPSAPSDAFQANGGWNTHSVTMIPSLKLVVVLSHSGNPGKFRPGEKGSPADRNLKILMDAVTGDRPEKW